ncbi:SAM-dependent methyltransferase, partial [Actinomadura adrarensis]
MTDGTSPQPGDDGPRGDRPVPGQPNIARVYDYLLGGKDNYQPDREFALGLVKDTPIVQDIAIENRRFLVRAVRHLTEAGVDQFIDLGSGLPTRENVHEVAQSINPDARVVYVDNDPVVIAHSRALLHLNDHARVVSGDLEHPRTIMHAQELRNLIDFRRPVAVLFVAVLHFCADAEAAVAPWREVLVPGSHLVISHAEEGERLSRVKDRYQEVLSTGTARTA